MAKSLPAVGVCLLCAAAAFGQPAWRELRARNPAGFELSLQLADPHLYRAGELIRARVRFRPASAAPLREPPRQVWRFAGLLLSPAGECGSSSHPCFSRIEMGFGNIDPTLRLGETSDSLAVSLNNYFPALRPGHYRTAALMRKQALIHRGPMSASYGYANPPEYVVSNAVDFEVVPASESWIDTTVAASAAVLTGPSPATAGAYEERKTAAAQLRFLDVPAAWQAALALLPTEEKTLLGGLEDTRQPGRVCELMRAAVPAPLQTVSSAYLYAMARTCARAKLPPAPRSAPPPDANPPQPTAAQARFARRWQKYRDEAIGKATASLAASVSRKQGPAKGAAFQTLAEYVQQIGTNPPRQPWPAWVAAVIGEFVKSYPHMDRSRQPHLLGLYASVFRSLALAPLLESVMDAWKPGDYYEPPREALDGLYAVDPAGAQARIAAELAKARTSLDVPQLAMLPAGTARIGDDALFEALSGAQGAGGSNVRLRLAAVAKYASPGALPRVRALVESRKDQCQPELMAYFVRVAPAYAEEALARAPTGCALPYIERTPEIAMGPVLEWYITPYLMAGGVPAKRAAARSLGRFGSPAALGPLWEAFRYFHRYWNGKQAELAANGEGDFLEVDLANAIARGRHWLATEEDLRTIESLCISARCQYEIGNELSAWRKPLRIELTRYAGGFQARVAQYSLASLAGLEQKLAQFPRGTRFLLTWTGGAGEDAARIRRFASAHGLITNLR